MKSGLAIVGSYEFTGFGGHLLIWVLAITFITAAILVCLGFAYGKYADSKTSYGGVTGRTKTLIVLSAITVFTVSAISAMTLLLFATNSQETLPKYESRTFSNIEKDAGVTFTEEQKELFVEKVEEARSGGEPTTFNVTFKTKEGTKTLWVATSSGSGKFQVLSAS